VPIHPHRKKGSATEKKKPFYKKTGARKKGAKKKGEEILANMAPTTATVPLIIGGQDYTPAKSFDIKSPITGQVVHKTAGASVADAAKAVDAAAEALKTWRKTTPQERQDILLKAADVMSRRRDELAKYVVDETGSTPGWADFNLDITVGMLKDIAGRISMVAGSIPATSNPNRSAIVLREPYGVVLSIAPWYGILFSLSPSPSPSLSPTLILGTL